MTFPRPWQCRCCLRWFNRIEPGEWQVRCAVIHAPSECCHYGDVEAEAPWDDYEAVV